MNTSLRNVGISLGIALAAGLAWPRAPDSAAAAETATTGPVQRWSKVSVNLPADQTLFPAGNGAEIANSQCLICHSAGMVLRQPPLTQDEWTDEINKMRSSYGAPLPADQVAALARYLSSINGRQSRTAVDTVDGQGS